MRNLLGYRPLVTLGGCVLCGILLGRLLPDSSVWISCGLIFCWVVCAMLAMAYALQRIGVEQHPSAPVTSPASLFVSPSDSSASSSLTSVHDRVLAWLAPVWFGWGTSRFLILLGMGLLCFGAWRSVGNSRTLREQQAAFEALQHSPKITVRLDEVPEHALNGDDEGYWQAAATLTRVNDSDVCLPILVSGYGERPQERSTVWSGRAYVRAVKPAGWPGAFDLRRYLQQRGLCGAMQLLDGYQQDESAERAGWLWRVDRLRGRLVTELLQALPDQRGAFLAAALFGYRKQLSESTRQDFQQAGVGHVLAISGLHVGMVAGILWFLLCRGISDRRIVAGLCILGCVGYVILSGGRVAAVRAGIMTSLYLGGFLVCRKSDLTNSLAGAALILMLLSPLVVFDMGFLLSFVAVLFIERGIKVSESVLTKLETLKNGRRRRWTMRWRLVRWVVALSVSCLFAWLGVMPLSVMAFGQAAPAGLLVNLFVMPWTTVVLAAGIGAQGASLLHLPHTVMDCFAFPAQILLWILSFARQLPDWISARPDNGWIALYYLGFALLLLPFGKSGSWQKRGRLLLGFMAAGISLVQVMGATSILSREKTVTLLQGTKMDNLVWTTPDGKAVLVATDGFAERDAVRYLRQHGVRPHFSAIVEFVQKAKDVDTGQADSRPVKRTSVFWKKAGTYSERIALGGAALEIRRGGEGEVVWVCLSMPSAVAVGNAVRKQNGLNVPDNTSAEMMVVLTPRVWPRQILYRTKKLSEPEKNTVRVASWQVASATTSELVALPSSLASSTVLFLNRKPDDRKSWFDRREFGAVRIVWGAGLQRGGADTVVSGYDGTQWQAFSP